MYAAPNRRANPRSALPAGSRGDKITGAAGPADAIFKLDGLTTLVPGWGTSLPTGAQNLKP